MELKKGIALEDEVINEVVKRTGLDAKIVKKNIEYINKRIYEMMADKNNNVIFITGLGYLFRYPHRNNKSLRNIISERKLSLNKKHGDSKKISIPNRVKPLFSKLKWRGFTEDDIEYNQNNEVVIKGILYTYKKDKK